MNANLLLSFLNTVIPFTVMLVQLISASKTWSIQLSQVCLTISCCNFF
jgi:hypothetical protein